jgi:hypothetical protein
MGVDFDSNTMYIDIKKLIFKCSFLYKVPGSKGKRHPDSILDGWKTRFGFQKSFSLNDAHLQRSILPEISIQSPNPYRFIETRMTPIYNNKGLSVGTRYENIYEKNSNLNTVFWVFGFGCV